MCLSLWMFLHVRFVPQLRHRTQRRVTIRRHHRRPGLRPWSLQDVVLDGCPTALLLCHFYVICLSRYNPSFARLNVNLVDFPSPLLRHCTRNTRECFCSVLGILPALRGSVLTPVFSSGSRWHIWPNRLHNVRSPQRFQSS